MSTAEAHSPTRVEHRVAGPTRSAIGHALGAGRRGAVTNLRAPGGPAGSLLALQRDAGNSAVSALVAAKLRSPGDAAIVEIDGALVELRHDEPDIDRVERGLVQAKAAGIPVDLEGPKPPASSLAVTLTGFGPSAVAAKKPVPPPKPVPPVSPLGKAAAAKPKVAGPAGAGATAAPKLAVGGAGVAALTPPRLTADKLLQPPVPPPGIKPAQDPAFGAVKANVKGFAAAKRAHPPAAAKAKEAQDAALAPSDDLAGQAKAAKADSMDAQQPGTFDKKAFIAAVKTAIEAKSPKTLKEADDYAESGKAGEVKGEVKGLVTQGKQGSARDIETATAAPPDPSKAVAKPVIPLAQENPGQVVPIPAGGAVPKPAPPEQVNLEAGKHQVNQEMTDANVTDEQLARSGEPEFQGALAEKKTAAAHATTAPGQYRAQEQATIAQGNAQAGAATAAGVQGMQGAKGAALAKVVAEKGKTKSKDEQKRAEVTTKVQSIFTATETDVNKILEGIDPKVDAAFEQGEAKAKASFETYVAAKMSAYKKDRYGGWLGGLRWVKDKIKGMPTKVNEFYEAGRERYLTQMNDVIAGVADIVGRDLTAAKQRIAQGRTDIATYVKSLPQDLQKVGSEAANDIGDRFEQLESDVKDKENAVVETLATKYVEARKGLDERIEELQAENKGLVDKAIGAIKAVINTIRELASMLKNALARAASVVGDIIGDPIGFLGNLIRGVKGGIDKFFANIGTHIKKGVLGWLFGQLGDTGIDIPDNFDIKGIVQLIASVFGLTWANIRNRIILQIGDKAMAAIEGGVEIFQVMATQGVAGLWEKLVEKVGDIKEMIQQQIEDFVVTRIITAGITWLLSLLNPASAFIKACKLIYDVVMFFVNNAARIAQFVNTVIDGVVDIAKGNVSAVVDKIEDALSQMVPILIGFMASVLSIGGIGEKIRSILKSIQKPITKAIDSLIKTGLKLAAPIIRGVKGITTKVKAKVAAGKAWVKGKAQAGKNWAKGKVAGARGKLAGSDETAVVRAARTRAVGVLGTAGATPESVRDALPGIKSEFGLAQVELRTGNAANTYHVHVQTAAADTPDRTIGERPPMPTDEIARATALIGERVVIGRADEDLVLAVVKSVDPKQRLVFCAFEHKQGRGRSKGTGRGFDITTFLKNYHDSPDILRPHSGGSHKSRYVIEISNGKYSLAPDYRRKWRSLFYGNDYGPVQNAEKRRRLTTTFGVGNGLRHPDDKNLHPGQRWNYEGSWYVNTHKTAGEATLDHEPPVVSHWNTHGTNTDQATRKEWFQTGDFVIMPRSVNSSYGSVDESTGERGRANWELGLDFRGPGESSG